jgi:hypothetical protein
MQDISQLHTVMLDISQLHPIMHDIYQLYTVMHDIYQLHTFMQYISQLHPVMQDISQLHTVMQDFSTASNHAGHNNLHVLMRSCGSLQQHLIMQDSNSQQHLLTTAFDDAGSLVATASRI